MKKDKIKNTGVSLVLGASMALGGVALNQGLQEEEPEPPVVRIEHREEILKQIEENKKLVEEKINQ